ncbi:hypothetical protein CHY_2633 [Carboxydothermus hydrogenoformans Z-2901]|uniref:Uncharacterized protein n=1 Tax=Carboxydothermus hydrogenoformans (strain ATCC BAA-161 / DSM 6008 / Z-2901) TaxID=246194 RepID=Q3A8V9_CARHZ|nr:hypothetical protein CHY_2633 [Carboxydothermus hydrogenoformans Z-2901]
MYNLNLLQAKVFPFGQPQNMMGKKVRWYLNKLWIVFVVENKKGDCPNSNNPLNTYLKNLVTFLLRL